MEANSLIESPRSIVMILLCFVMSTQLSFANEDEECNDEDVVFSLYCPPTLWLDCNDEVWNLNWLPNAYYHDYTGTHDAGYPEVKYHLNDCNIGYITRTWKVSDYHGYWHKCTQTIHVKGNYFNSSSIQWPGNVELEGCNPPTDPEHLPYGKNMPTWSTYGASCSKIGYNYHDNVYTYGPGCYEIIRTWTIVDCCNFNPWTNTGIWTYNQRIQVTSTGDEPEVWVPYDVSETTYNCDKTYVNVPPLEVKDGCDEQYIIVNDSPYATSDGADASGYYPPGTHKVLFKVKFNCWKVKHYYVYITVTDDSTPVPYCYYGLAVPLMGVDADEDGEFDDGMLELWASDLDAGSYQPCKPYDNLRFSFSSDPNDNVRTFTCEDVGEKELEIWVTDSWGRQDYCGTYIDIQNNAANIPNCDPITEASISGRINSVFGNTESLMMDVNSTFEGMEFDTSYSVQEVFTVVDSVVGPDGVISYEYGIAEVEIPEIDSIDIDKDFQIDLVEGDYLLEGLDLNEDYTLTLYNEEASSEYVNAVDVAYFEAYLIGDLEMSMYQKMAADLNHDMVVDQSDLDILKSFVEGEISEADIDLSWVTFDPTFEMTPENADLEVYPASRTVEIKNRNATDIDLLIFQMGDITDVEEIGSLTGSSVAQTRDLRTFEVEAIMPNPFTNATNFKIFNNKEQEVRIDIFDVNGRRVTQQNLNMAAGAHTITIDRSDLDATGIYLYVLVAEEFTSQGKLILID